MSGYKDSSQAEVAKGVIHKPRGQLGGGLAK